MADNLLIGIKPKLVGVDREVAKLGGKFKAGGKKAGGLFSKTFIANFTAADLIARGISKTIGTVNMALRDSVDQLRSFSRATAEINSILPITQKLTEETKNTFVEFSAQFGTDATLQAKSFYNIVSAGIKGTSKQLDVLKSANKAAVAGLVDINAATRVIVSSMNSYSKSGKSATNISDALFVAVREGLTTFDELSSSLGTVAPVAASVGVSFEDLTGAISFITKAGVRTDIATTQLRQTFASILKPTKEAADEAKRLGIEFNTAALKSKGIVGFFDDLRIKTGGNNESLTKLFGNIRALSGVMRIVKGDFQDFSRIVGETNKSANATATAFKEIEDNLDFQIKKFQSEFKQLALLLAKEFEGTIRSIIGFASDAIAAVKKIVDPNSVLTPLQQIDKQIASVREKLRGSREFTKKQAEDLKDQESTLSTIDDVVGGLTAMWTGQKLIRDGLTDAEQNYIDNLVRQEQAEANLNDLLEIRKQLTGSIRENVLATSDDDDDDTKAKKTEELITLSQLFKELPNTVTASVTKVTKELSNLRKASLTVSNAIRKGFASGLGAGFAAFGAALAKGENALDAFLKSFLGALGQMMIQQGTAFILQGLGFSVIPGLQASGGTLIATGAALAVAGGALTAVSGGSTSTSGGAGGGEAIGLAGTPEDLTTLQAEERLEPSTHIAVNIQGDVLDSEESGTRIVQLINDAFDRSGIIVNQAVV